MKVVRFIERVVFESQTWKFILLILAITLIRTGIWQIPNLELSLQIAQDPFLTTRSQTTTPIISFGTGWGHSLPGWWEQKAKRRSSFSILHFQLPSPCYS
jgi:hypothetical protein